MSAEQMFGSIFENGEGVMTTGDFFIILAIALVLGFALAVMCSVKNSFSKSFLITMSLLPSVVSVIIIMVNGSIGIGVAVAGAFSLVRFRSAPGSAREICAIFISMAAGLALGTGYVGYAALFTVITGVVFIVLSSTKFGEKRIGEKQKTVKITIPECLDYTGAFDDTFAEYTTSHKLVGVKTTNMGSMFKLTYDVVMKDTQKEKEFIDALRVRNGNLEISVLRQDIVTEL